MTVPKKPKQQRTFLRPETEARLESVVSLCDAADLSTEESMAIINNGALGYRKRTEEQLKNNEPVVPLTIGYNAYWKFKKLVRDPEYQKDQILKMRGETFMKDIRTFKILMEELIKRSIKNLLAEPDPEKNQRIINGITRNLPYYSNYSDVVKRMIEKNKIPTLEQK